MEDSDRRSHHPESASTRRKPKGRFGGDDGANRANFRHQERVFDRVHEGAQKDSGEVTGADAPARPFDSGRRNPFSSGSKSQRNHRPSNYGYSQRNVRTHDDLFTRSSPRTVGNSEVNQLTTEMNQVTTACEASDSTVQASGSVLNVKAEPFVPKNVDKPGSTQNLTKLGKVKRRRPRHVGGARTAEPDVERTAASKGPSRNTSSASSLRREPVAEIADVEKSSDSSALSWRERHEVTKDTKAQSLPSAKGKQRHKQDSTGAQQQRRDNRAEPKGPQWRDDKQRQQKGAANTADNDSERHDRTASKDNTKTTGKSEKYVYLHSFAERKPVNAINVSTQRETLIETLTNATYECTICYGSVTQETAVWSCGKCYHMFHIYCVKKWANTLIEQNSDCPMWRCPTCQEQYSDVPNQYRCFCRKIRDPVWNNYDTPHSCGEICGMKRADNCTHPCNELCHPGACPSCNAFTSKHCKCRRSFQKVKCSQQVNVRCSQVCNRKLNCLVHTCTVICHAGSCQSCDDVVTQDCYCGENKREIICGSDGSRLPNYSCDKICGKPLSCGNHSCEERCHGGSCPPCCLSPEIVTRCSCGKTAVDEIENVSPRTACTDAMPTCSQICGKLLPCRTESKNHASAKGTIQRHFCPLGCHVGDCSCNLTSAVTCTCGHKRTTLPCAEADQYTKTSPYKCEKKCSKKRECTKHRCGLPCCTLDSHPCLQICGKRLSCGLHKCEELCHIGNCPTCFNVCFDELHCRCGATVMYPPIACGCKPPVCSEICNRMHPCEHPVTHICHSEESCPPCVVLTTKLCMGEHEFRNNIPCYIKDISCGRLCEKPLLCDDHKCLKMCHKDNCGVERCRQACRRPRPACGHACGSECHPGTDCPPTDCRSKIILKCQCGNRQERALCYMKTKKLSHAVMTLKMKELNSTIDIAEMMSIMEKKQLDCDESCAQLERNRRMASALDIMNPEILASLAGPQVSEFLKAVAKREPAFIADVEKALMELVDSVQQSKHERRSHIFKPMKKDHRQAIHELAELYCCETASYDDEPQRNVVATAHKGKSCVPTQTVTSLMKSEKRPRAPVPIPINVTADDIRNQSKRQLQSTDVEQEENRIDYFEMT